MMIIYYLRRTKIHNNNRYEHNKMFIVRLMLSCVASDGIVVVSAYCGGKREKEKKKKNPVKIFSELGEIFFAREYTHARCVFYEFLCVDVRLSYSFDNVDKKKKKPFKKKTSTSNVCPHHDLRRSALRSQYWIEIILSDNAGNKTHRRRPAIDWLD